MPVFFFSSLLWNPLISCNDMKMQNVMQVFMFFFKCRHNDGTMKQFPHTVFNISITCATQKRRGLPNTELHICTIHFFF